MTEELTYAVYQERQLAETQIAQLLHRSGNIHYGHKFEFHQGQWQAESYPGYAILAMLDQHPGHAALIEKLQDWQEAIIASTALAHKLYPLPPASFHQTIANLLSAEKYFQHIVEAGLVEAFPTIVAKAMAEISPATEQEPIAMRLLGLSLFGSALGVLGVFEKEQDFQRILDFRQQFYHHPDLQAIGIRRTRPFIGHITLLYFGADIQAVDGEKIAHVCAKINAQLQANPLYFNIQHAHLMRYPHLAEFNHWPHFPNHSFLSK